MLKKFISDRLCNAPIWQKIVVALVLGIITGLSFGSYSVHLKPLGDAFLHALHMVIVPVILSAVVCAVISVSDFSQMRRITIKAFLVYILFLILAIILALVVGNVINPGISLYNISPEVLGSLSDLNSASKINISDIFLNMIPRNPVAAFVNENILQIVIFGILLGSAINLSGEQGKPVVNLFHSMSKVSMHLTHIVMKFAPFGVYALISWTFGMFGIKALWPLLKFIITLTISCLLLLMIYSLVLLFYIKKPIKDFFIKIMPAIVFALSTTSSGATLPISIECLEEKLGAQPRIAKFMLPLGCNFNLAGLAIYLTTAIIFTANMYGIVLNFYDYIILTSTVVLTTMGTGAIPGSAIVVMSAVITAMGMPLGALPLIAGIDRINDMIQTATNVISDIFAAYLVSESETRESLKVKQDISKLDPIILTKDMSNLANEPVKLLD